HQRVLVAVLGDVHHALRVAGGRAFVPQLVARARPEPRLARLAREAQRLVVHVSESEHFAGPRVLDDGGNQFFVHRNVIPSVARDRCGLGGAPPVHTGASLPLGMTPHRTGIPSFARKSLTLPMHSRLASYYNAWR